MEGGTLSAKAEPTLPMVCGGGVQSKTRGEESMNIPNQMNYIDMNRDDAPNLVDQFRKQVAEAIALE